MGSSCKQEMAPTQWSSAPSTSKHISNEVLSVFSKSSKCTSLVEITLSCRNLLNKDIASKSDPYCVVFVKWPWQEKFNELDRTEVVKNNLNPEWVKKIVMNYHFESIQYMRFEIRDQDIGNRYDLLGSYETTLSDIVAYSSRQFVGKLKIKSYKDCGDIVIVTEEVSSCKQIVHLQFRAENLTRISWLSGNDAFLVIYRSNEDGSESVVARTERSSSRKPIWDPLTLRATSLCNGDLDRSIKIDCFDYRKNGNHKLIGTCYTTLRTMESSSWNLMNGLKKAGLLHLQSFHIFQEITFLDYIRGGTQIHFAVAIDFTESNGHHDHVASLHHLSPRRMNPYEIALKNIGEIIQHYDNAKLFPAFGFGAKLPSGEISHQFPLNGNPSYPYCSGVEDILYHYRNCVRSVTLYGPTNFAPVINNTSSIASNFQDGKHYFVLLIITDGIISDMHQTKSAIISASTLPISIIIVGVGDSRFTRMDELDSDNVRLSVDGRYAERDIVQFVPLNNFLTKNKTLCFKADADLAKEVLIEIPQQITGFMESRGYRPQITLQQVQQDPSHIVPTAPMF